MTKRICVVGGGRWGRNHIRTLSQMGCLAAITETNNSCRSTLCASYPTVACHSNLEDAMQSHYDGYVLATPAGTHYHLAKRLILNGLNVLIEKPMTLIADQAQELVDLAKTSGSRLMVGHVLLFHPAIRKIKEVIGQGLLGKLFYVYSTRLNLGTVRTEENVFWSFAPHDISVLDYLIGSPAIKIRAKGAKFLQESVYDVTMTVMEYPGNVHGHILVSWIHPFKEQRLVVVGSRGMISFDDSSAAKDILFYNKRVEFVDGKPLCIDNPTEIIPYERKMPLEEELRYFIAHLDGDEQITIADGDSGYQVVKILEEVQKLIVS